MKIDLDNITRIVTDIFCHSDNKHFLDHYREFLDTPNSYPMTVIQF